MRTTAKTEITIRNLPYGDGTVTLNVVAESAEALRAAFQRRVDARDPHTLFVLRPRATRAGRHTR